VRGLNRVIISGNISDRITYSQTGASVPACSFSLASDRHTSGDVVTAWVKCNVYGEGLVRICKSRLHKGTYVLVEGELMNRDGHHGELLEVRVKDLIFLNTNTQPNYDGGSRGSGNTG
jgi:single-stranded DNA-binding protein